MARKSKAAPDAIQLLKKEHAEVTALFARYEDTGDRDAKVAVASEICRKLTIHALCEEELLYPAAHEALDSDLVYEAEVEHRGIKDLVSRIEDADPDDEDYDAMITVLCEYVRHHVKEEEGEMFPQLRRSDIDLDALGLALAGRRIELEGALGAEDDDDDEEDDEDEDESDDEDDDIDDDEAGDDARDDDDDERARDRAA